MMVLTPTISGTFWSTLDVLVLKNKSGRQSLFCVFRQLVTDYGFAMLPVGERRIGDCGRMPPGARRFLFVFVRSSAKTTTRVLHSA